MFHMNFFCEILWVVFHGPWYGQSCIFYINLKIQKKKKEKRKYRNSCCWAECSVDVNQRCWPIESLRSSLLADSHPVSQTGWLTSYTKLRLVYLSYRLLPFLSQGFGTLMLADAHSGLSCVPEELPPFSWISLCFQYCSLLWYLFCLMIIYLAPLIWLVYAFYILFCAFSFILSRYI